VAARPAAIDEDGPSENIGDLNAMFAAINNLPADDPLHKAVSMTPPSANTDENAAPTRATNMPVGLGETTPEPSASRASHLFNLLPAKVLAAFDANGGTDSALAVNASDASAPLRAPATAPSVETRGNGAIVVDAGRRVAVPVFTGSGLRLVVEQAAGLGLRVEPVGSGIAREQAPAAGTMVPLGTEVVVRFAR
jgi:cell division protein FtsI (penicillin-binding protein 3)